MTSDDITAWATAWVVVTNYGGLTFYSDENLARDNLRRTDTLYRCRLSDWKVVP